MLEQNEQADKSNTDELEYAGFWARVGASIADAILLCLLFYPLLWIIIFIGAPWEPGTPQLIEIMMALFVPPLVIITFWVKKQATPGKMSIHAKIVNAKTGLPPSLGQYVTRYLFYWIFCFLMSLSYLNLRNSPSDFPPFYLGMWVILNLALLLFALLCFLWVAFNKRKQGWHDKIAGTVVVRDMAKARNAKLSSFIASPPSMKLPSCLAGMVMLFSFAGVFWLKTAKIFDNAGIAESLQIVVTVAAFLFCAGIVLLSIFTKRTARIWRWFFLASATLLLFPPIMSTMFFGDNVPQIIVGDIFFGVLLLVIGLIVGRNKGETKKA